MRAIRPLALAALTLTLGFGAAAPASPAPPTSADIRAKINEFYGVWRENSKSDELDAILSKKAGELLEGVDLGECGTTTIQEMGPLLQHSKEHARLATERLAAIAADPGADGAEAALVSLMMSSDLTAEQRKAALTLALDHSGLSELGRTDRGGIVFRAIESAPTEMLEGHGPAVFELTKLIDTKTPAMTLTAASGLVLKMNDLEGIPADKRNNFRKHLIGLMQTAAETESKADEPDERLVKYLERQAGFLDGAFARGALMNHQAPALTITWCDDQGDKVTGLDALKGKVVVLDFWATWCGPCIASFPNMRELQERYNGYDVVILGVTSIQGRHYPGDGASPVDCDGDPAKEMALMSEFMKAKDMTWRTAFTKEEVFNPDYGVRGIPHVAIVDAKGIVRYNNLHPMDPMPEKCGKIDKLLAEAGLPAPAPLPDTAKADG